jgi:mannose-6-phosphate isomerase-like protein (cupin superfamily)
MSFGRVQEKSRFLLKMVLKSVAACVLLPVCLGAQVPVDKLGLYFGDWRSAPAHMAYGSLSEQDIFVAGDALNPVAKGAVLRYANAYRHASLAGHASTSSARLTGRQQVYFVVSGKGTAMAGSQTVAMSAGIALLMPAELGFTLKNTGDAPLEMYVMEETTPSGFRPNTSIVSKDENAIPFSTVDKQWSCMEKQVFVASDGLATLDHVSTISLDPLTISRPEVTASPQAEAVWTAIEGTSLAFVSNQVMRQDVGVSFLEIPDGKTPHSVVNNSSTSRVRFLYFSHRVADAKHAK